MKNIIIPAVAYTTLIASPAFAQSYDPSVGSGTSHRTRRLPRFS